MSWFTDNKFLAIFGGVVLAGAGALGYLTMGASSKFDDAQTKFNDASSKLNELYNSKPYPMDANVKEFSERQKTVKAEIDKLQRELSAIKIKTEEVAPNQFQDKLKDSVAKAVGRANDMGISLGANKDAKEASNFYLGFNSYKDKPPTNAATAAALLKELRAMELVFDLLLSAKQAEIKEVTREELKEELKAPEPSKKGALDDKSNKKPLIQKNSFSVHFVTNQGHLQSVMNGISANKEQIFVIRNLTVKNTEPNSPPKVKAQAGGGFIDPNVLKPPQPADPANPGAVAVPAPAAGQDLETVFGTERVDVVLHIDIVDVAEPDAPVAPAAPKGNNKAK